jgi:hypothetical protein
MPLPAAFSLAVLDAPALRPPAPAPAAPQVVQLQMLIADFDLLPDSDAWRRHGATAGLQAALAARRDWQAPLRAALERRYAATRRAAAQLHAAGAVAGAAAAAAAGARRRGTAAPRGALGMAPRARASPRDAALEARRRLLFARQRIMWAALLHGAAAPTPGWVSRCLLLLQPLIPRLNARVAAGMLQAAAAAPPSAPPPGAVDALAARAVECCAFTRGPLLLKLLEALAAATDGDASDGSASEDGSADGGASVRRAGALITLRPRQQRLLALSVLRGCSDMSPAQAALALALLRRMGVLPPAAGASWLRWLCRSVEAALCRMQPRHVAAAVGVLTAAACDAATASSSSDGADSAGLSSGDEAQPPLAPARLLAPVLHAALTQLAAQGEGSAHGLGSQRLATLLVALGLVQQQEQRQARLQQGGRPHAAAAAPHDALAQALLARLEGQLAEAAARLAAADSASAQRVDGSIRRRRPWQPPACRAPGTPALPGALLLQLAASLPALPARPPRRVAAALARRAALLSACDLAPRGLVRSLWIRSLGSELRAAAASASHHAHGAAAAAAAAAEAERVAAAAAAALTAPPLPLGAVRRLRSGGSGAAVAAALRRRLAELAAADAPAGERAGDAAGVPLAVLHGGDNGAGGLLLLGPPGEARLPGVLSSLLELRFARLMQAVVARNSGSSGSGGDAVRQPAAV